MMGNSKGERHRRWEEVGHKWSDLKHRRPHGKYLYDAADILGTWEFRKTKRKEVK